MSINGRTVQDYEKRLCISYLDEADAFQLRDILLKTIVSITAKKNEYINNLESSWKQLRITYNIPQGQYIHFNKIKNLTNINAKTHEPLYKNIFLNTSDGNVDYFKIYNFYMDILSIIKSNPFTIQATGIASLKSMTSLYGLYRTNSAMYQLFREHLDRMAGYLLKLSSDDYLQRKNDLLARGYSATSSVVNNLDILYYLTKLRYDGSYVLTERNDYRNAFSHSISDGTKHFNGEIIKEVFDTLSFISKDEVGLCTNCSSPCNYELISHAGDELVDFITLYVARDMWKDYYKTCCLNMYNEKYIDVVTRIDKLSSIQVQGYPVIVPIVDIKEKIFGNTEFPRYGRIIDF
ncbi:MAG: hypothetical protein GX236_08570 [Clostridiaceae bacterium]|jgi:hypothetical protein|nr:hypothetical protein [Clostridiaceae bacterium]